MDYRFPLQYKSNGRAILAAAHCDANLICDLQAEAVRCPSSAGGSGLQTGLPARIIEANTVTGGADVGYRILVLTALISLMAAPATAQEPEIEHWPLPGTGAGALATNPADGSLWVFFHQTRNLVALDPSDGSTVLDIPLGMSPAALDFSPDGKYVFLVGEPLADQIIDAGMVVALDASDGAMLAEQRLEGACGAIHVASGNELYVAAGMQYAHQGTVYKLGYMLVTESEDGAEPEAKELALEILSEVQCGKIPWATTEREGMLYVTDLELQWTAQTDGSAGPPYGSWVWIYDAETLDFIDREWVGINPNRLRNALGGVLVACSGCKQSEGEGMEPTLALIRAPGDTVHIRIDTAGATDLASAPDGSWGVATLADWGPPAAGSRLGNLGALMPDRFPEQRRWVYTGHLALVEVEDERVSARRIPVLEDGYLRAVAASADGAYVYALRAEPEEVLVIPVSMLESSTGVPLVKGNSQDAAGDE